MLELKGIRKSYKIGESSQLVLKGIDIAFRKNEFTSILGSSGSGKTTLLNIIGGLDVYDEGELIIDGTSTKNYKDRDWDTYRNYRVGFVFQSYNLIMHQTILQNVEIALTLSGVSKNERRERAIEALNKVGLGEHINKRPNQLSGGQMQRVAIARALVNNPEIILADEPTGALDSKTSVQIMDLLKEIAGDKLVIMVTHNPELAKQYSTRIIELKDGLIVNDSDPYEGGEEAKERQTSKTSMSLLTALSLSLNNLLTKKGRAFMTAFAGSIGIIGIALIMALSNGVNELAKSLERDSLSDYPISIQAVSFDLLGGLTTSVKDVSKDKKIEKDKLYSSDDLVSAEVVSSEGLMKKNNLYEFKKYIESNDDFEKNAASIVYNYDLDLQVYTKDANKVNPCTLKEDATIFSEIVGKTDSYKVLSGKMPESADEVALVVGSDHTVNDSLIYSIGLKDQDEMTADLDKAEKDAKYKVESTTYSLDDFMDMEFKVILNTDYYVEEDGKYTDMTLDKDYIQGKIDAGKDIKIVGILENENADASTIGYTHDLSLEIIDEISKTSLYEKQIANKEENVLTNEKFDGISNTYEGICKELGIYEEDNPSSISIYPNDYDSKTNIEKLINKYNDDNKAAGKEDLVIKYDDMLKSLVGGTTKVINSVSYVLIGFVAISLIVSSIMIGIITYISVLERTKEIGILRAIGASKRDITRVFRAETLIEGLVSGVLGVVLAVILTIPINFIVGIFAKVDKVASMPPLAAIILVVLSMLLNVVAGNKPARMAAKKDPVEALRSE
ncbi:MAG: ATP-binding cassette domain-containing protein [Lachnospiraceae bacterium]|nr:ATP-binding cassette domain-containing protein [Lachnospiraceae bacterium]